MLHRRLRSLDLHRLRSVSLDQPLLNRLTGDGTLILDLTDRLDPVRVTGLARAEHLYQVYHQLRSLTVPARATPAAGR